MRRKSHGRPVVRRQVDMLRPRNRGRINRPKERSGLKMHEVSRSKKNNGNDKTKEMSRPLPLFLPNWTTKKRTPANAASRAAASRAAASRAAASRAATSRAAAAAAAARSRAHSPLSSLWGNFTTIFPTGRGGNSVAASAASGAGPSGSERGEGLACASFERRTTAWGKRGASTLGSFTVRGSVFVGSGTAAGETPANREAVCLSISTSCRCTADLASGSLTTIGPSAYL